MSLTALASKGIRRHVYCDMDMPQCRLADHAALQVHVPFEMPKWGSVTSIAPTHTLSSTTQEMALSGLLGQYLSTLYFRSATHAHKIPGSRSQRLPRWILGGYRKCWGRRKSRLRPEHLRIECGPIFTLLITISRTVSKVDATLSANDAIVSY